MRTYMCVHAGVLIFVSGFSFLSSSYPLRRSHHGVDARLLLLYDIKLWWPEGEGCRPYLYMSSDKYYA